MTKTPTDHETLAHQCIEQLVREEWGKLLACLIAHLGDFQLAEDALQDGLESALYHWQRNGLPRSPAGWLLQTARRKAIDRIRRAKNFQSKQKEYQFLLELDRDEMPSEETYEIPDERLRLMFTCCHPALNEKSRMALTLRTLGGLTTDEIARAFLDSENAMAQRLVRAKRKIKVAKIPFVIPEADQWNARLGTVLDVLYLIYNQGYFSTHGDRQIRQDLSNEAIRLTEILRILKPGEPEIEGLLALMLLHDSRRGARHDEGGNMIALDQQDRSQWDHAKIETGLAILNKALRKSRAGPYQIQAAISAVHSEAKTHAGTPWDEIVLLYDALYKFSPNPIVILNKCVAVSYAHSPEAGLKMLGEIEATLSSYQPLYATKADLYRRCGKLQEAESAYLKAIDLCDEDSTRVFLQKRLGQMLGADFTD